MTTKTALFICGLILGMQVANLTIKLGGPLIKIPTPLWLDFSMVGLVVIILFLLVLREK